MSQLKVTIKNPKYIHLRQRSGDLYYGCNQEWFGSSWQRQSGCGPSVASNILMYLHGSKAIQLPQEVNNRDDCIKFMEEVWNHVTPTERGVNTLELFCNGVKKYLHTQGYDLECFSLEIPNKRTERPSLNTVVEFIAKGLQSESPVAFLNLSNGMVANLDRWHWVTIVGLEADHDNGRVSAEIFDAGQAFAIDLKLWYETTTLGGGFVYFKG